MQMKRILGILLALCFLMSVTAAAVAAEPANKDVRKIDHKDDGKKKNDEKKIEQKVVKILKVVKTKGGIKKLELIKFTEKSRGHIKKVWFATKWVFVPFHEVHMR